jgi:hypothetical protein
MSLRFVGHNQGRPSPSCTALKANRAVVERMGEGWAKAAASFGPRLAGLGRDSRLGCFGEEERDEGRQEEEEGTSAASTGQGTGGSQRGSKCVCALEEMPAMAWSGQGRNRSRGWGD